MSTDVKSLKVSPNSPRLRNAILTAISASIVIIGGYFFVGGQVVVPFMNSICYFGSEDCAQTKLEVTATAQMRKAIDSDYERLKPAWIMFSLIIAAIVTAVMYTRQE